MVRVGVFALFGVATADTCSLYEISDGSCGQSDLDCAYTKYAKAAEKGLKDGTCADQGYTHETGTQTKTYPIIGDIVITTYDQALASTDTTGCGCEGGPRGNHCCIDAGACCPDYLSCGVGIDQGLCVSCGGYHGCWNSTKPVASSMAVIVDQTLAAADTCSLYEISDGSCGQSDLDCAYTKYAKAAEKGLKDGTCADQGYTHETGTQTKTYPIIGDIVITTYDQALASTDTTSCGCEGGTRGNHCCGDGACCPDYLSCGVGSDLGLCISCGGYRGCWKSTKSVASSMAVIV